MAKKKKGGNRGLVYSTDPDFDFEEELDEEETLEPGNQKLYVELDKKQRGGKKVTLVAGFIGTDDDFIALGKELKKYCGVGGSAKDGDILVQGDCRDKVVRYLEKQGYVVKRRGG